MNDPNFNAKPDPRRASSQHKAPAANEPLAFAQPVEPVTLAYALPVDPVPPGNRPHLPKKPAGGVPTWVWTAALPLLTLTTVLIFRMPWHLLKSNDKPDSRAAANAPPRPAPPKNAPPLIPKAVEMLPPTMRPRVRPKDDRIQLCVHFRSEQEWKTMEANLKKAANPAAQAKLEIENTSGEFRWCFLSPVPDLWPFVDQLTSFKVGAVHADGDRQPVLIYLDPK